ncbi:hypothetical protein HU200_048618 [Digitaria exilis]|uniref:DUF3444 domain-containing protein n=1 Tax=Digitaria exilis TaxID=1010633 RepID=A0A835AS13_9POAL|nr:hypothetical protein HU200_048618 [Digitaria exilis]
MSTLSEAICLLPTDLLVTCIDCGKNFFAFKLDEQAVPSRFLSAAPNNCQVSQEIVFCKHVVPDQLVQYSNLHATGVSMDSTRIDEPMKWSGISDGYEEGSSETRSNMVRCSPVNETHSSSPSADKGTAGSLMLESPDSEIVANQNLCDEDASAVLNSSGSCNFQRLCKRNSHSRDSYNNKRQRGEDNSFAHANPSDGKMYNDNIAGADNQADEHVPSTVESQNEINATQEGSQHPVDEKIYFDNFACVDSKSTENLPDKVVSQGDGNAMHKGNANSNDEKIFSDHTAGADSQSAEYFLSKVDSQSDGNATQEHDTCYGNDKMFNDSVAGADHLSAERLSSIVYSQGGVNTTHDGIANTGDDEMFNGNVSSANNQSSEHLPSDRQVDGNGTHDGTASSGDPETFNDIIAGSDNQTAKHFSSEVDNQRDGKAENANSGDGNATHKCNMNSEVTDTVGEKSCNSGCLSSPDKIIFDFEKFRDINLFAVGQIWALYDNLDGMPRFYVRIMQLDASDFKVHLEWLEYDAMNEGEDKWAAEELPVACGKFCLRKTRYISQNRSMFSHIVRWTEGKEINSYLIHPIEGEVWALYKGWSMEWSSNADNHRSYEYEIVEVLPNISAYCGATVIPLVRINGFVSLFARARDKSSFTIPSSELLQFSHRIPFYRTTGSEKVGIPRGFLELDTASLPCDLDAAFPSVTIDCYNCTRNIFVGLRTDSMSGRMSPGTEHIALERSHCEAELPTEIPNDLYSEQDTSSQENAHGANDFGDSSLSPKTCTYHVSNFHDFEELRSHEKFECGQIWALYSDADEFPNFYGWVNKVEMEPFKVHLTWLEACPQQEQEEHWLEQVRDWSTVYETNSTFSHVVHGIKTRQKWQFEILPQVGEVWATYLNWSPDWTPSSNGAKYAKARSRGARNPAQYLSF